MSRKPRLFLLTALLSSCATDLPPETEERTYAAVFPTDSQWNGVHQFGVGLGDPTNDGANNGRELVGDAANAAFYLYTDGTDVFFRLRVDDNPAMGSGVRPFGWGVLIDTNGNFAAYEYLVMVDGTGPDQVAFSQ